LATTIADTLHLHPAASFEGRVTIDGKSAKGVRIGAQEHMQSGDPGKALWGDAVTDASGRFHMGRLNAGVYNVIADLQDNLDSTVTDVAHEGLAVAEGQTKKGVDFFLIPGGVVTGTVSGPNGSPLAGILVGIYGPAHPRTSAWVQNNETGKDGRYKLRVPPGENYIYLQNGGDSHTGQTIQVRASETTTVDFKVAN